MDSTNPSEFDERHGFWPPPPSDADLALDMFGPTEFGPTLPHAWADELPHHSRPQSKGFPPWAKKMPRQKNSAPLQSAPIPRRYSSPARYDCLHGQDRYTRVPYGALDKKKSRSRSRSSTIPKRESSSMSPAHHEDLASVIRIVEGQGVQTQSRSHLDGSLRQGRSKSSRRRPRSRRQKSSSSHSHKSKSPLRSPSRTPPLGGVRPVHQTPTPINEDSNLVCRYA